MGYLGVDGRMMQKWEQIQASERGRRECERKCERERRGVGMKQKRGSSGGRLGL